MQGSPLPSGTLISHYRIISSVGSGGMGEVYLAHDERLGRKIALKILPAEFISDRHRLERFEREARSTSSLNHPNILTIYDLGEEGGRYFIASEFIDGETLRQRFDRRKPKLRDIVEISIQVAGALSAAHAEGVVHRDIKPENIMIRRDGYVKVLDFGLAKLSEESQRTAEGRDSDAATVHRATDPGVVMGTVQYMSPEQAQGQPVDGRSDIFSLGVVMYEMITGHPPFEGATKSHIIVSILEKHPAPLQRHAPEVPPELQRIISKCLVKESEERYQVAKDLMIDLKALRHDLELAEEIETRSGERASSPAGAERPALGAGESRGGETHPRGGQDARTPDTRTISSAEYLVGEIKRHKKGALITTAAIVVIAIAVLTIPLLTGEAESGQRIPIAVADFANQTGQPELDGLSGMLITSLEQSRRLAVMTRSRMFDTLKRLGKDKVDRIDENLGREICRAENVNALVTASISKFGDLYILDLKVLDPEKNEYLFTAKEQGKGAESIPGLIDRLSEKTRLGLKEKSGDVKSSSAEVANVTTPNLEAYQHYFRGRQLVDQLQMDEAEEELKKAVALDPTFALAHYARAYALNWSGSERARPPILEAVRYINKAPEKEQYLIRAYRANIIDRDWDQTIAILKQFLERYPNEKEPLFIVGDLSYHKGDFATAENYLKNALKIDPKFEPALQHLVWTYRQSGQNAKMLQQAQHYLETMPSAEAYVNLSDAYALSGNLDKALEVGKRGKELFKDRFEPRVQVINVYVYGEDFEAAAAEARTLLTVEAMRPRGYGMLASVHAYRGEYRDVQAILNEMAKLATGSSAPTMKGIAASYQASAMAWSRLDDRQARQHAADAVELKDSLIIFANRLLFDAYAVLRDFEAARQIAKEHFWGNPGPTDFLNGLERLDKGDATGAVRELEKVIRNDAVNVAAFYYLAQAQLEAGQYDQAIDSARRSQRIYYWQGPREHVYPRTYYLLGKIYERKGDRKAALENYRKFLDLWKTADRDLPELIDAKNRVAQLRSVVQ